MRTVLIIGGDGFIGSHLRDHYLNQPDTKVISVDKDQIRTPTPMMDNFRFDKYDLQYFFDSLVTTVIKDKPDIVYNCLAVANPGFYVYDPVTTFDIDFQLNLRIIKMLHRQGVPFVHFSTSEVYGKRQLTPSYGETTSDLILGPTQNLRWIYATSKILLEQLINAYNCNSVVVRCFNFVGHDIDWIPVYDGQKEWIPRVYSCFMNSLMSGESLKVVNPGTQKRCYTHIDDAISALALIDTNWNKCKGKVFNIGVPENEISILELAKMMTNFMGEITEKIIKQNIQTVDGTELYGKGYEDSERRVPDISLIRDTVGWQPKFDLETTFKASMLKTIETFKDNY